jgi:heat shock protein HtpX
MAKRLGLFLGVNLLIVLTITTVTSLLGIQPYLSDRGINLQALAVFSLTSGVSAARSYRWRSRESRPSG